MHYPDRQHSHPTKRSAAKGTSSEQQQQQQCVHQTDAFCIDGKLLCLQQWNCSLHVQRLMPAVHIIPSAYSSSAVRHSSVPAAILTRILHFQHCLPLSAQCSRMSQQDSMLAQDTV